ncbi:MAG: hypothetical protein P8X70_02130 [Nanoarchaeota archaeon]
MESWLEILRDLGIFTIAAFMIKKIFEKWINKDFEKFKHKLKQERIISSKLYDKRGEVIDKTYELLEDFNRKMSSLTSPAEMVGDLPKIKKLEIAGEAGEKFINYYSKKRIYFNDKLNNLLENLNSNFIEAWIDFTLYPPTENNLIRGDEREKWKWIR